MKTTFFLTAALLLATPIAAQAEAPFHPFAALSRGSDCRITLNFPDGEFCGETVTVDSVRSWYFGNSNVDMVGQRYDFGIVVYSDAGTRVIPIRFLNPGTAKRFYVQMGAWTGKPSSSGSESPFPNWLELAR